MAFYFKMNSNRFVCRLLLWGGTFHVFGSQTHQMSSLYQSSMKSELFQRGAYPEHLLFQGFLKCHTNQMFDLDYRIIHV